MRRQGLEVLEVRHSAELERSPAARWCLLLSDRTPEVLANQDRRRGRTPLPPASLRALVGGVLRGMRRGAGSAGACGRLVGRSPSRLRWAEHRGPAVIAHLDKARSLASRLVVRRAISLLSLCPASPAMALTPCFAASWPGTSVPSQQRHGVATDRARGKGARSNQTPPCHAPSLVWWLARGRSGTEGVGMQKVSAPGVTTLDVLSAPFTHVTRRAARANGGPSRRPGASSHLPSPPPLHTLHNSLPLLRGPPLANQHSDPSLPTSSPLSSRPTHSQSVDTPSNSPTPNSMRPSTTAHCPTGDPRHGRDSVAAPLLTNGRAVPEKGRGACVESGACGVPSASAGVLRG